MLSGTARYSASAVQCLNNNFLSLSDDPAVEALLQDIPFFAVGLLGFGVATIMFVCRRMARPGIFIVVSIVLAFVAATLDLFRILFEMRTSEDNTRVTALFIAREVCIALGQSSRFLFFWDYARRSPIDSSKTRPGIARMALEGGIIVGAVAVAVVQTVWRLAPTGVQQGPVYLADMILELVLGAVLSLKIVRFFFVRGTPASYIRRGVPIVGGIAIQMGINIASLFVFDFEDSMLGRFLQAIELYIIVLVVLIASMDDPSAEQLPVGASSGRPVTSRSSFMAMAIRNSLSPFRPAPGPGSSSNGTGPRRPSMTARMPTVDRVSQWITRRMSARTVDRVENAQASVRLWTKPDEKDLESAAQIVTMDEKAGGGLGVETAGMDASPGLGGFREQQVVATWRDPVYTAVGNGVLTPMTADTNIFSPPARPDSNAIPLSPTQVAQLKAARRASIATSVVLSPSPDTVTRRSSSNSRSSRSIPPVYRRSWSVRPSLTTLLPA
ncbi:hypothetical protein EXIGLDRAFT_484328 [Exidia glandulosa HHB12029]|uniref:Uncharacterized protein n=1 Tax=Exidia glandulosa HHB12029 TaxID=1314781 RepID=A0A165PJY2_EXIGL|nr:hypothetical protein EXIGLDRAFT_484328 [Exidia glandulosa HHB12029]